MLKHLQTSLLFSFLLTITGIAIAQIPGFPGACSGALQALNQANQTCLCSNRFETRQTLLIPSLKHFENLQSLGCDDGHEVSDFCGGIINTACSGENCKYEVVISSDGSPVQTIVLEIGETVTLEAAFRGPKCLDCQDRINGCDILVDSNLETPLVWAITDEDILEFSAVAETAVVLAKASGVAEVCAASLELYSNCVSIEVPGNIVDIVFVIENSLAMDFWIGVINCCPGLRHHGGDIIAGMREHFSSDSRIAIVTYNRPLVFPYNQVFDTSDCTGNPGGEGYTAPAAAFTEHMEFRFLIDIPPPSEGFESLVVLCGFALHGNYTGAFVYSALMHAMEGSANLGFWREEVNGQKVEKVIVLIGWSRPGGDIDIIPWVNDPEPFTGFTRETVIQEAQQRDVEIHIFHVATSLFLLDDSAGKEGSREVFTRIAQETGGTYQETEFSGSYPGEQLYQGIIDTMDEMGN